MKGVPIKFRAKDANGTYIYGDLIHGDGGVAFMHKETLSLDSYTRIDPATIAQLVNYDDEGNEVYECDLVEVFIDDTPEPAHLIQALIVDNFFVPKNTPGFKYVVVKWE